MNASELMVMFRKSNPDFLKQHTITNVSIKNEQLYIRTDEDVDYIYDGMTDSVRKVKKKSNPYEKPIVMDEVEWRKGFSKRLRAIVEKQEISVARLSRLSGVSECPIRRYISGKSIPSAYKLICIAKALDVSPLRLIEF